MARPRLARALSVCRVAAFGAAAALVPAAAGELPQAVRIEVEQLYEYRKPSQVAFDAIAGFELPVADYVEDMLYAAGVEPLLGDDPGEAGATVRIRLRGQALGSTYFEPVKAFLYTGAQLSGDVAVLQPGEAPVERSFAAEIQRPFQVSLNLGYEDPHNAPFQETLEQPGGFVLELAAALAEAWGTEAIVPSLFEGDPVLRYSVADLLGDIGDATVVPDLLETLADDHPRVRWESAWALGRIGAPEAVPDLIAALEDESEDVRWFSSWSLRTITGEDFGQDPVQWQAWWDEREADTGT